jgi:transcriptional regulator with XRE-family HTH domain
MTPFGDLLRALRDERSVNQKEMAAALGVSPAYLSALERGRRGVPSFAFRQKVIAWANVIWDEAEAVERVAELSSPRVVVDTSEASARATLMANLLAERVVKLDDAVIERLIEELEKTSR